MNKLTETWLQCTHVDSPSALYLGEWTFLSPTQVREVHLTHSIFNQIFVANDKISTPDSFPPTHTDIDLFPFNHFQLSLHPSTSLVLNSINKHSILLTATFICIHFAFLSPTQQYPYTRPIFYPLSFFFHPFMYFHPLCVNEWHFERMKIRKIVILSNLWWRRAVIKHTLTKLTEILSIIIFFYLFHKTWL